jgi:hypothetical protein
MTHTQLAVEEELGWLFRSQPTEDYGIDAHAEVVDGEDVWGRLLALQIKSGTSWFGEPGPGGWWFRPDAKHVRYWLKHSLPVVVVLYHPLTKVCYWQLVTRTTLHPTSAGGWKLLIPKAQVLDADAATPLREAAEVRLPYRSGPVPPLVDDFQHRALDCSAPIVVLSGMGGVGKTQLAAGIAESAWTTGEVEVLVWVAASCRHSIVADFARAAGAITGVEDDDADRGARRLLDWLAGTSRRWLVVLDDLQVPGDAVNLWPPQTPSGRVVVTTRRRDAGLRGLVEVDVFTMAESMAFLTARFGHLTTGAERLAKAVGHLPLALSQAAAYALDRQITCDEYVTRFTDRRRLLADLSPEQGSLPDQHLETMATTWSLSVELADRLAPQGLAAPTLQVASLLSPDGIPTEVFTTRPLLDRLGSFAGRSVSSADARDALRCLHRLNLVTCELANGFVRVHTLVQRATRDRFDFETWESLPERVADALLEVWPAKEINSTLSQSLRTNTAALKSHAELPEHTILVHMGNNLGNIGQARAAFQHFVGLYEKSAQRRGLHHSETLLLAHLCSYWQAHLQEPYGAMLQSQLIVALMRRYLGRNHPYTLIARTDLALWQGRADYFGRAISTLKRVLPHLRRTFGDQSQVVSNAVGSLAFWQGELRQTSAAMSTTRRQLRHLETRLGTDHPDTLTVRHNLALLISNTGDHATAINHLSHVLADQTRVLGPGHPHTLKTRHNLAVIHSHAGDPHGAALALIDLHQDETHTYGTDDYESHQRTLRAAAECMMRARTQPPPPEPRGNESPTNTPTASD